MKTLFEREDLVLLNCYKQTSDPEDILTAYLDSLIKVAVTGLRCPLLYQWKKRRVQWQSIKRAMKDPIAIPNDLAVFSFKAWRSAFAVLAGATIAFAFRIVIKKKKRRRAIVGALAENRSQKRGMFRRSFQE